MQGLIYRLQQAVIKKHWKMLGFSLNQPVSNPAPKPDDIHRLQQQRNAAVGNVLRRRIGSQGFTVSNPGHDLAMLLTRRQPDLSAFDEPGRFMMDGQPS